MMHRRRLLFSVLIFLVVLGVGAWPWRSVRVGFSHGLSALANPLLRQVRLDRGVLLQLAPVPADAVRGTEDNVEADTQVVLSVPGTRSEGRLGLSLRRDAYLPLLIFAALILAFPLRPLDQARSLALGVPVVLAVGIASIVILVVYLLSQRQGTAIPGWQGQAAEFVFERWLTPPGNRVIAPVLFALALGGYAARASLPRLLLPRPSEPKGPTRPEGVDAS